LAYCRNACGEVSPFHRIEKLHPMIYRLPTALNRRVGIGSQRSP